MLDLIKSAAANLKDVINPTPVIYSSSLSRQFGFESLFKLENLQKTGSFKVRGAYNRVSALSKDEKARGVVTASSGNHAQGVAWASTLLGVSPVVVMPETTPIIKYMAARGYGAVIEFCGASFDDAERRALEISEETGRVYIPPFDDPLVMAGQGTVGLEIMEAVPDADAVVVPIGGGGLISGIAGAVKGIRKGVKVIGAQAMAGGSCMGSLKAGRPIVPDGGHTIADGIAVKRVGRLTLPVIQRLVDDVVLVNEDTIADAILLLIERKKIVAEGAGAVSLAAAIEGKLPPAAKKVVFVISGGNIDVTTLDRVIRTGLVREGRVLRLKLVISDSPGSLAGLTAAIAAMKANILHITHEREAVEAPIGSTMVDVMLEVEGREHAGRVTAGLRDKGYGV